jgi:hypothetical protein
MVDDEEGDGDDEEAVLHEVDDDDREAVLHDVDDEEDGED